MQRQTVTQATVYLLTDSNAISRSNLWCCGCCVQILRYLVACDRLCERGYDEAQVEEALEMFQNCETKVNIIDYSFIYLGILCLPHSFPLMNNKSI